jgi:hypothetical protein
MDTDDYSDGATAARRDRARGFAFPADDAALAAMGEAYEEGYRDTWDRLARQNA